MPVCQVLEDLLFVERGYLNANHFVYRAEEPVLIDTGYSTHYHETERAIRALGIDPARTRTIVTTHCHCDHVGGNRSIQLLSGCEVALHRVGKGFIDARDDWSTWWSYFGQEGEFFDRTRGLEDGEELLVGPHRFRVIHTPGHAADGIVLYHQEEKVLLSSDTLWEDDIPVVNTRVEGEDALASLLDSLERLRALDVRVVFPGHGSPFTGFREALDRAVKRLSAYADSPQRVGDDLIRRILVYTLLMKPGQPAAGFFRHLLETRWYPETVDRYFDGEYEAKYREVLQGFLRRSVIRLEDGLLYANVRP